jgi:hypothetical protein
MEDDSQADDGEHLPLTSILSAESPREFGMENNESQGKSPERDASPPVHTPS